MKRKIKRLDLCAVCGEMIINGKCAGCGRVVK